MSTFVTIRADFGLQILLWYETLGETKQKFAHVSEGSNQVDISPLRVSEQEKIETIQSFNRNKNFSQTRVIEV